MSVLDLSRWQFAFTVIFHMTFPALTVGLAVFLAVVYGAYWRTGKAVYLQMFRFWKRIFAVGFGLGVVSGAAQPSVSAAGASRAVNRDGCIFSVRRSPSRTS